MSFCEYKLGYGKKLTFIDRKGRSFVASEITDFILSEESDIQQFRSMEGPINVHTGPTFEMTIKFGKLEIIEPEETEPQEIDHVSEPIRMIR